VAEAILKKAIGKSVMRRFASRGSGGSGSKPIWNVGVDTRPAECPRGSAKANVRFHAIDGVALAPALPITKKCKGACSHGGER
jgi:hypothetical protein